MQPIEVAPLVMVFLVGFVACLAYNAWFVVFLAPAFMSIGFLVGIRHGFLWAGSGAFLVCWIAALGWLLPVAMRACWGEVRRLLARSLRA